MVEQVQVERRHHQRYPFATGVQFHHGPTQSDFAGRCVNISDGGMKMFVPPNVPVLPGQPIRLMVGSMGRPEFSRLSSKPVDGTIVRVDRGAFVAGGQLAVGIRFAAPAMA